MIARSRASLQKRNRIGVMNGLRRFTEVVNHKSGRRRPAGLKEREPSKYACQNSKMSTQKRLSGEAPQEPTLRGGGKVNTLKACVNVNHIDK